MVGWERCERCDKRMPKLPKPIVDKRGGRYCDDCFYSGDVFRDMDSENIMSNIELEKMKEELNHIKRMNGNKNKDDKP